MSRKVGTLDLICGPSGAGKSTRDKPVHIVAKDGSYEVRGIRKSYRVTTRKIRADKGEVDTRDYHPAERTVTHGFFVSEREFESLHKRGLLVGVHRYPDPQAGAWYGFYTPPMLEELNKGVTLREHIAAYEPIAEIAGYFQRRGIPVEKELFLAGQADLERRLKFRRSADAGVRKRIEENERQVRLFLEHRYEFERVGLMFPQRVTGEPARRIVLDTLARLREGELPDELFDDGAESIQRAWSLSTPEQRIPTLIVTYENMLHGELVLTRNHFIYHPEVGSGWTAINFLNSRPGELGTHYVIVLGIAQLLEEHGLEDEAEEEREGIKEAMDYYLRAAAGEETGTEPDRKHKTVVDLILPIKKNNDVAHEVGLAYAADMSPENQGRFLEKVVKSGNLHLELYGRLCELQGYLLLKEWGKEAEAREGRLAGFYNSVAFHIALEQATREVREKVGRIDEDYLEQRKMGALQHALMWGTDIRERVLGEPERAEWGVIQTRGEHLVLNSLRKQIVDYSELLRYYVGKTEGLKHAGGTPRDFFLIGLNLLLQVDLGLRSVLPRPETGVDDTIVALAIREANIFAQQLYNQTITVMDEGRHDRQVSEIGFPGKGGTSAAVRRWWRPHVFTAQEEEMMLILNKVRFGKHLEGFEEWFGDKTRSLEEERNDVALSRAQAALDEYFKRIF